MLRRLLFVLCGISLALTSCKHDAPIPPLGDGNYPAEVSNIIMNKCVSCHNATNYKASGGLRLDTWEQLFKGGNNGAAIVAYNTQFSPLLYFINTDQSLGTVSEPRMPEGQDAQPLSKDEYLTISNWVKSGAPDKSGNIAFSTDAATRQKIYLTMQGCDLLGVIDAQTNVIMRYVNLGKVDGISEAPHAIRFTEDGKFAFVSLSTGNAIQKIDATTDQIVYTKDFSFGSNWNIVHPSHDGSKFVATEFNTGQFVYVDIENSANNKIIPNLQGAHGIASNATFDTFYVSAQTGNVVFKVSKSSLISQISLDGNTPSFKSSKDPHEVLMSPDYSKYFLSCQQSNEVIIMDRATDKPLATIPVGTYPQELAISKTKPYLFVSCSEDNPHTVGTVIYKGSVHIINYQTNTYVGKIEGNFSTVHGITVDDKNGRIYIASRNPSGSGPAPHHTTNCGNGKNGYYNVYDLNTLQPAPDKRFEVTPDPYSLDTRFK
jgi:YVTN family beta-propeller protein